MATKEADCYVCGEPCYSQGATYNSICRRCAIEAYKLEYNEDKSTSYFSDLDPKAGDGIDIGVWKKTLETLKLKYGAQDFYIPPIRKSAPLSCAPASNDMPCGRCGNEKYSYEEMVNRVPCWNCGQLTEN